MEAEAVHDFSASAEDELGFRKEDANWYMAEQNGRTGLIPCNYISMANHDWYVKRCTRNNAEERLLEIDESTSDYLQLDGSFLIRKSEADGKGFSLSVKEGSKVSHFKILQDGKGKYFIWLLRFDSVNKLIDYHRRTSVSRNCQLFLKDRVPSKKFKNEKDPIQRVIAKFDFQAQDTNHLGLRRGDVVEVICQPDPNWILGCLTMSGKKGLFPVSYVDNLPPLV